VQKLLGPLLYELLEWCAWRDCFHEHHTCSAMFSDHLSPNWLAKYLPFHRESERLGKRREFNILLPTLWRSTCLFFHSWVKWLASCPGSQWETWGRQWWHRKCGRRRLGSREYTQITSTFQYFRGPWNRDFSHRGQKSEPRVVQLDVNGKTGIVTGLSIFLVTLCLFFWEWMPELFSSGKLGWKPSGRRDAVTVYLCILTSHNIHGVFPLSPPVCFPKVYDPKLFAKLHFCSDSFRRWMRAWSLARMWVSPIGGSCPMKPGRRKGKPGSASLDLPIGSLTHSEKMQVLVLKIMIVPVIVDVTQWGDIPTYTTSQNCVLSDPSCASSFPSFDFRP